MINKPSYLIADPELLADEPYAALACLRVTPPVAVIITRPNDYALAQNYSDNVRMVPTAADAYALADAINLETDRTVLVITETPLRWVVVKRDLTHADS